MRFGLLLLPLVLMGCGPDESAPLIRARVAYDYVLQVPPHYVRQNVFGEDSKVEQWKAPGVTLTTDFGHYTGRATCMPRQRGCSQHAERIAGRRAQVTRSVEPPRTLGEDHTYIANVYIPVVEHDGRVETALGMGATCSSAQLCDQALQVMRTVRLVRTS